jgi:hypothetical protein
MLSDILNMIRSTVTALGQNQRKVIVIGENPSFSFRFDVGGFGECETLGKFETIKSGILG